MASNAMYDAERAASSPSALYEFMLRNSQPSVDERVARWTGMQPGMDRSTFLPRYDPKLGFIAPNILYNMARTLVSPGVAAQGGYVSPEDAFNFAGNVSADALIASAAMKSPAPGPGKTLPMTVYHGSPHSFDAFDMSKIGTGEGAQAYGHGLYVADMPGTAKTYQAMAPDVVVVNGQRIGPDLGPNARSNPVQRAYNEVTAAFGGQHENPFKTAKERLTGKYGPTVNEQKAIDVINEWQRQGATVQKGGHFYTVDLPDEHIAKMLDWDKPLSEQPESVRNALEPYLSLRKREILSRPQIYAKPAENVANELTVADIYDYMANQLGSQQQASAYLHANGIPGIKYFDGGSRAAGSGTRNYVVFDDNLLKILKRE